MDPVSLGLAAAALIASGAAGQFATQLGDSAWHAAQALVNLVRADVRDPQSRAAVDRLVSAGPSEADQAVIAEAITARARADADFLRQISELVAAAGTAQTTAVHAVAYDQAKQVNIGGNHSGPINLG